MAEAEVNLDREHEESTDVEGSSSVLAGLNLALIISSLSLSDEEPQNFEEIEKKERERKAFHRSGRSCGSIPTGIPSKRREVNEFRAVARQMAKAKPNAKIRDCRHGRKM